MPEQNPYAPPEGELKLPEDDRSGQPSAREVLNRRVGESRARAGLWAVLGIVILSTGVVSPGRYGVAWVLGGLTLAAAGWYGWWGYRSKARLLETEAWDEDLVRAGLVTCLRVFFSRGVGYVIFIVVYFMLERWSRGF